MILTPALIGGALGALTAAALWLMGYLHRAGIIGLIIIVIAGFWPLFAVAEQNDAHLLFHLTIFATFGAAALFSHRIGLAGLALVLIAHGVFDLAIDTIPNPAPAWWPPFCAAYDVALGAALLLSLLWRKPA